MRERDREIETERDRDRERQRDKETETEKRETVDGCAVPAEAIDRPDELRSSA